MKVLFISAENRVDLVPFLKKTLQKLPKKFGLVTTAQYLSQIDKIKEFFRQNSKEAVVIVYGQILGCKVPHIKEDNVLYIGDGEFHPKGILLKHPEKKVIALNPFTGQLCEFAKKDIEAIEKRKKAALVKFLSSQVIGVLFSVKSGQSTVQGSQDEIKKNLETKYPDKKFYYFACDTLDINELENFPFVEVWVNTMCPRFGHDDMLRTARMMINYIDLVK